MATPTDSPKPRFVADLVERTIAALPPELQQQAHTGGPLHGHLFATATMIELAQQTPGPMSEKAKAFQAAQEAAAAKAGKP